MARCAEMGTIAGDIQRCGAKARALEGGTADVARMLERAAARRLGAHYLMRYALLVAYRGWLAGWLAARREGHEGDVAPFHEWFDERKELRHLLDALQLE